MKNINKKVKIKKDNFGYLINYLDWNESIAKQIAREENILLNSNHWEIIYFIRNFYIEFNIVPPLRILSQSLKKKIKRKINSCDLFNLFPKNPILQSSKIAGIPKPNQCI
ncbi:TusE/DsrC/DsvC family sulfur relay protein [Buchnera aphidicola (Kurisakia onigurumii)]|uniref:TusE/DsrC/DsvC family sulfur relay protein n=1 Tax=Buchnera aphidicola TaxID=9 RepID=UPI0031B6965F